MPFDAEKMKGVKAVADLVDADRRGKVVIEAGKKISARRRASSARRA